MGMHDAFDEKVLKIVRADAGVRFTSIVTKINRGRETGKGVDTREVDRALQRLRKQGKVYYRSSAGWYAA